MDTTENMGSKRTVVLSYSAGPPTTVRFSQYVLREQDYPILGRIWDNPEDAAYDKED